MEKQYTFYVLVSPLPYSYTKHPRSGGSLLIFSYHRKKSWNVHYQGRSMSSVFVIAWWPSSAKLKDMEQKYQDRNLVFFLLSHQQWQYKYEVKNCWSQLDKGVWNEPHTSVYFIHLTFATYPRHSFKFYLKCCFLNKNLLWTLRANEGTLLSSIFKAALHKL
jgi:hypothetical protein